MKKCPIYFLFCHIIVFTLIASSAFGQKQKNYDKELRRLNAKIDRVRVLVDSLEFNDQRLLPEVFLVEIFYIQENLDEILESDDKL